MGCLRTLDSRRVPPSNPSAVPAVSQGHPNLSAGGLPPAPPKKGSISALSATALIHGFLDFVESQQRHSLLFFEALRVPDLDLFQNACENDLGREVGVLAQGGGDQHAALLVDGCVARVGHDVALQILDVRLQVREIDQVELLLVPDVPG